MDGEELRSVVARPRPDGSTEWWELTSGWSLLRTDPPIAEVLAAHTALPDAHHLHNVGITGTKTLGGFKFTFTNGLLTGFEPA